MPAPGAGGVQPHWTSIGILRVKKCPSRPSLIWMRIAVGPLHGAKDEARDLRERAA